MSGVWRPRLSASGRTRTYSINEFRMTTQLRGTAIICRTPENPKPRFFVEGGINIWHQHQEAVAQQLRDEERKRQRAEEARLRFEAAQRQKQSEADQSYMDLDLDDLSDSGAKIPLEALMTKGVQAGGTKQGDTASRQAAGGMSASELDMALIEMDASAGVSRMKRA